MTKVKIEPGICGLVTSVEAESEDQMEVRVKAVSYTHLGQADDF